MLPTEQSQIIDFFNKYTVAQTDPETTLVSSKRSTYLVKEIQLDSQQTDIDNVLETLEQHQTFNSQYLLTLINYTVTPIPNTTIHKVRTFYHYAQLTLKEEIENRKATNSHFNEEELWTIIYSVTKSLQYLQKLNIGYGVLSCDKIYIEKKIKLIDPSAVAQDPLALAPHRLYSPQIINQHSEINILKSDVFVMGLCILEAVLLISIGSPSMPKYDQTKLNIYLEQVEHLYNAELSNLIKLMLQYSPEDRPSFSQIREYLQNTLQMTEQTEDCFNPLPPDSEDTPNLLDLQDSCDELEIEDTEEEDQINPPVCLNQYQKAKIRFLCENSMAAIKQLNQSQTSRFSEGPILDSSTARGNIQQQRKTSKSIKDKLVKKTDYLDLEVVQIQDYKRNLNFSNYDLNVHNHLFTHPKLLEEIKKELKHIANSRNQLGSKQNMHSCNF